MVSSCYSPAAKPLDPVNSGVINFKDFSLNTESVNLSTKVTGTAFIKGDIQDTSDRHIYISAQFEIDPQDWGGISFHLPRDWKVIGVMVNYPEGTSQPQLNNHTAVWSAHVDDGYYDFIAVGRGINKNDTSGGGKGSIIIESDPVSSKQDLPENVEITVAAESKGEVVVNPIDEKISIPLNVDYRKV